MDAMMTRNRTRERRGGRSDHAPLSGLLGIDEAAEYLGIGPGTLRNWLSMKRIAYVKIGRLTKVSRDTLDAYIAAHTVDAVLDEGHR